MEFAALNKTSIGDRSLTESPPIPTLPGQAPPTPPPSPPRQPPHVLLSYAELMATEAIGLSNSHTMLLNNHLRRLQQTITVAGRRPEAGRTFHATTLEKLARMTVAFRVSVAACQEEARVRMEAEAPLTMLVGQTSDLGFGSMEWRVQEIVEASLHVKALAAPSIFGNPTVLMGREPEVQALITRASTIGVANSLAAVDGDSTSQQGDCDWIESGPSHEPCQWGSDESEVTSELSSDTGDEEEPSLADYEDDSDGNEARPLFRRRGSSPGVRPLQLLLRPLGKEEDEAQPRGRSRTRWGG